MTTVQVMRRATRLAALGVALTTVVVAASCRDIVTDDVIDAEAALCGSFESCDIDARACQRVSAFFDSRENENYADYLAYYVEWSCGESCGAADVCLDFESLCDAKGTRCTDDFECCDASTGAAACKNGLCCYDLGVVCDGPEDCCPLEDGTVVGCFTRQEGAPTTCGGIDACNLRGDACEEDDDCCGTARCTDRTCQPDTCVERDAPCRGSEDCCVAGDACDGTCKPPDLACDDPGELLEPPCCMPLDAPCAVGGAACCGGAVCLTGVTGEGVCRPPNTCGPPGTLCDGDDDCCSNGTDAIACVALNPDGSGSLTCGAIGCQPKLDAPCGANGLGCCSGMSCLPSNDPERDGFATTCQQPCQQSGCHDIRAFGAPLDVADLTCLEEAERGGEQIQCAAQICAEDPFCCCYEWSPICVDAALVCLGLETTDPAP